MGYRELRAPAALAGLVECGWIATATADGAQQVLPDGCMDLVWTGAELLVAGPDTVAHHGRRRRGVTVAGLRFVPGALPSLLGVPAAPLHNRRVAARRAGARARPGRAGPARGGRGSTGPARRAHHPAARRAARPVGGRPAPRARPGGPGDSHGVGRRRVGRRHRRRARLHPALGAPPLPGGVRLRPGRAAAGAAVPARPPPCSGPGCRPPEVAAAAGYADQPHLSRETRALAGASPGQLASGANRSTPLPSGSSTTA